MFKFSIDQEVIVKMKIGARKDTGQKRMYWIEGWVEEDTIVPVQGLDEAIDEEVKDKLPKNGGLDAMTTEGSPIV